MMSKCSFTEKIGDKTVVYIMFSVVILCYIMTIVKAEDINDNKTICKSLSENQTVEMYENCSKNDIYLNCSGAGLLSVPEKYNQSNICHLDLTVNRLTALSNFSFSDHGLNASSVRVLYLANNIISHVAVNAFINLTNLLCLDLIGNQLEVKSFEHGVFKPLVNLEELNLKENLFNTVDGLDNELVFLKKLITLFINPRNRDFKFGLGMRNLTYLRYISLSGNDNGSCEFEVVGNDTFTNIPQIKNLYMHTCNISVIEANALSPLKNLTWLDISYNEELTFRGMNKALYGLRNSSTLETLNVKRIHTLYGLGIMLNIEDIENLRTLKNLKWLFADLNKIEVFNESIFEPKFLLPETLQEFTLAGNRLTYGKYVKYISNARNISKLDISRQHLSYDPFFKARDHHKTRKNDIENSGRLEADITKLVVLKIPENLKSVKWQKSFLDYGLPAIQVNGGKKLENLDLSFNLFHEWVGPVYGLSNLKILKLSENNCIKVNKSFFQELSSLEVLNISGNPFYSSFDPRTNVEANVMLKNLTNLIRLDMSHCSIRQLPKELVLHMHRLEELRLNNNHLSDFNITLNNCLCLTSLDLSHNNIDKLAEEVTHVLDLAAASPCNQDRNISVDLSGNPIDCSCDSLPFFKWVKYSKIVIHFTIGDECRLNGRRQKLMCKMDFDKIIEYLENDPVCFSRPWITWVIASGSAVLGCIVTSLIGFLIYRHRWKLRYLYYIRNRRFHHEGYEHLFAYDAVISYSKSNASFIKNDLVPVLEGRYGLQLWVSDRNSQPGVSIAENITHAIYNSRKTVLLIDTAYLKDNWCNYDMNMALVESVESKRQLVIVVLMASESMDKLPIDVLRFLQRERSLEYPNHGQDMDTFWTNLAFEIRSNCTRNK